MNIDIVSFIAGGLISAVFTFCFTILLVAVVYGGE